ncbi:MAG: LacI family DNA-binding transcriptional regulator [Pseudomonadota bacterium]
MSDVAQAAGVSPITVSRSLRENSPVARDTREHVLRVVKDLGYVPDQLASGLASQRSGVIATMVPSLNNPHFADTVGALSTAVAPAGLQVLIAHTEYDDAKERQLLEMMLRRRPEAVVLTYDGHDKSTLQLIENADVPTIQIWETPAKPLGHVVGFSNVDAAAALAQRLIDQGYTRFCLLGEAADRNTRGAARRSGFRRALKRAGLDDSRIVRFTRPPITMQQGARALPEILDRWPDTEVVLCVSDPCAFGVQAEAQRLGIDVPQQLAVAGFGDFDVSRVSVPDLTTVAVDASAIGRLTGELILELREAQARGATLEPQTVLVPASPILRGSTSTRRRARGKRGER